MFTSIYSMITAGVHPSTILLRRENSSEKYILREIDPKIEPHVVLEHSDTKEILVVSYTDLETWTFV